MNSFRIKSKALDALHGKWEQAIGLTFIMFLVNVILISVVEIILYGGIEAWSASNETFTYVDFVSMGLSILLIPFIIGVYWFYLDLYTDNNPKFSSAFNLYEDGKTSLKTIGASFLQTLFIGLWTVLFVVPGIIKTFSYSQTFYIMKEHPELSVLEAITESRKRMDGFKFDFFVLNISFIGWAFLATFSLGIGYLWLIPYMSTSMAAFYKENISTLDTSVHQAIDTEKSLTQN